MSTLIWILIAFLIVMIIALSWALSDVYGKIKDAWWRIDYLDEQIKRIKHSTLSSLSSMSEYHEMRNIISDYKERRLRKNLRKQFIPVGKKVKYGANKKNTSQTITYDSKGTIVGYKFSNPNDSLYGGEGFYIIQPGDKKADVEEVQVISSMGMYNNVVEDENV